MQHNIAGLTGLMATAAAAELMAILSTGERLLALDIDSLGRSARAEGSTTSNVPTTISVIKLHGSIVPRGDRGMEGFRARLASAANNPDVGAVVLDIDSPGGAVAGTAEAATAVKNLAKIKPVYALADTLAASAAYWIGSQATQLWVTPSGSVGSIGVIGMHMDVSQALEQAGIKATVITAGKHKGEMSPFAPLSESAAANLQGEADAEHANFIKAVAEGRKVSQAAVASDFGQGRVINASRAVSLGMADHVGTMADLLGSLRTKSGSMRRRASFDF